MTILKATATVVLCLIGYVAFGVLIGKMLKRKSKDYPPNE